MTDWTLVSVCVTGHWQCVCSGTETGHMTDWTLVSVCDWTLVNVCVVVQRQDT